MKEGRTDAAGKSGYVGVSVAGNDYNNGASGGDAALAGLAYAAVTWIIEDQVNQHAIDQAKRDALEQAGQALKEPARGLSCSPRRY